MAQPRIFLMADYPVGVQVARFLKEEGENVVGLAVHPPRLANIINLGCTEEIISALELEPSRVFDGEEIRIGEHWDRIRALQPDLILVVFWAFLLPPEIISIPRLGCVNWHNAYLPYNRGANPNVWSIIEHTPAGATLHYIDPGIDSGDIIAQSRVPIEPTDTGATLYKKTAECFMPLFLEHWRSIKSGTAERRKQTLSGGTIHRRADLKSLDEIHLEQTYTAEELIDLLRARTFAPFSPAYFVAPEGRKVGVRVSLEYLDT